ncbi:MAG TPA: sulfite exporter TauE/SafE family protein [Brumimicrobium sp.]|nr:sulfite exporter TauE/SafE family protein [Brumimicrobium sp.]
MESYLLLILLGVGIGTLGTLIGAGGGFILVPVLILLYPTMKPESLTAVSLAIVMVNAWVGTWAYYRKRRIDFKAGIIFAISTIPGSILGVFLTTVIPRGQFDILFGIVLTVLALFLFIGGGKKEKKDKTLRAIQPNFTFQQITDKNGVHYEYAYRIKTGIILSLLIGFFSPLFGIGGGIIHVPAMTELLHFPVHIATATSQFVLGIMAMVSVIVHYFQGSYDNSENLTLIFTLGLGVIPGALLGARISNVVKGKIIIRILSISLGIIGLRIIYSAVM